MNLQPVFQFLVHLKGFSPERKLRKSLSHPRKTQWKALRRILSRSGDTEFGRKFHFAKIKSVGEFQKCVPIQTYESLLPFMQSLERGKANTLFPERDRLIMFGLTSGSTGKPKKIPITNRYVKHFRQTYSLWCSRILHDHPDLLGGRYFGLFSDWKETVTDRGIPCGAVTGLLAALQPPWIRRRMAVPLEFAGIKDPEVREKTALHHGLSHRIALFTAANPSSLLRIFQRLETDLESALRDLHDGSFRHREALPADYRIHPDFRPNPNRAREIENRIRSAGQSGPEAIWPELVSVACWMGGSLSPYLDSLRGYVPTTPLRDPGLVASEGRFTTPIEDETPAGLPELAGMFFEFFPFEEGKEPLAGQTEKIPLADELEVGAQYYLLFTTEWGLYRYHIDDIVEVTGKIGDLPLLRFLRKGSSFASVTGEKISEDQFVQAIGNLGESFLKRRPEILLAPFWGNPPGYLFLVEEGSDVDMREIVDAAAVIEKSLKELNLEYESKRKSNRLAPIRGAFVSPGAFGRLRQEEISRAGGRAEQHKMKLLRGDFEFLQTLGDFRIIEEDERRPLTRPG